MSLIEQNMEESKIEKKDSLERLIQLDDNFQFNSDIFYLQDIAAVRQTNQTELNRNMQNIHDQNEFLKQNLKRQNRLTNTTQIQSQIILNPQRNRQTLDHTQDQTLSKNEFSQIYRHEDQSIKQGQPQRQTIHQSRQNRVIIDIDNYSEHTQKLAFYQNQLNEADDQTQIQCIPQEFGEEEIERESDLQQEESSDNSSNEIVSVQNLIQGHDEKMNFEMLNHSIYEDDTLFKLCMACCLADNHLNLAIQIVNILMKLRHQQILLKQKNEFYMQYLEIIMAYIYLRLNQQQFQKQYQNINAFKVQAQQNMDNQGTQLTGRQYMNLETNMSQIGDSSRDYTSQLNRPQGNNQNFANPLLNNFLNLPRVSSNIPIDMNQFNQSDRISASQISYNFTNNNIETASNNTAIKNQIFSIIQSQDYFLSQAQTYFKKFDVASCLNVLDQSQKSEPSSNNANQIVFIELKNIMTLMFLNVQEKLRNYKQLKQIEFYYILQSKLFLNGKAQEELQLQLVKNDITNLQKKLFEAVNQVDQQNRNTDNICQRNHMPLNNDDSIDSKGLQKSRENAKNFFLKLSQSSKKQDNGDELNLSQKQQKDQILDNSFKKQRPTANFGIRQFVDQQISLVNIDKKMNFVCEEEFEESIQLRITKNNQDF